MANKKRVRTRTGLFISCLCGSKAAVVETGWGYYAHCPHCGGLTFFRNPALLEKIKLGAKRVCDHQVNLVKCKGGMTSWCEKCRVRTFMPPSEG